MAENLESNDTSLSAQQPSQQERVGDILYKERVTRRITLETIAKDLKINVKYVKAIESSSYNELPPEPYVRVYIRSIASYLMLNPDDILKQFYKERGIVETPVANADEKASEKVVINVKKDSEKKSFSLIVIVFVIVVVSVLLFISSKIGLLPSEQQFLTKQKSDKNDSAVAVQTNARTSSDQSKTQSASNETVSPQTTPLKKDSFSLSSIPEINAQLNMNDSLKLTVRAIKDSLLLQVFTDGIPWKNHVRAGNTKVFFARDSIALSVEEVSGFVFMLNDEDLQINGAGQKIFKIDHTGLEYWKPQQWKSTYKTRL